MVPGKFEDMIEYTFIKSKRRSIGITVKPDGSVVVRAPLSCTRKRAEEFVTEKQDWIIKAQKKMADRRAAAGISAGTAPTAFTGAEITKMKKQAKKVLLEMAAGMECIVSRHSGSLQDYFSHFLTASSGKGLADFHIMKIIIQILARKVTKVLRHACLGSADLPVKLL